MNSICIVGRLGRDPETRQTSSGKSVCNFSVAVSEGRDKTTWFNVTTWEKTAEIAGKYLAKGKWVGVTGRMQEETYQGKDGEEKRAWKLIANNVHLIGDAPKKDADVPAAAPTLSADEFDVPF